MRAVNMQLAAAYSQLSYRGMGKLAEMVGRSYRGMGKLAEMVGRYTMVIAQSGDW
jgi:hypothetical protein